MKLLKKITDKKILYIFTLCIVLVIPILKQTSFYLVAYKVINNYDSINTAYVLFFSIPFLIYIYIKNIIKTKRKLDIYDHLFYLLVFAGIIATIFSINKNISLLGKAYRHEGFLSLLTYYLLFINWKLQGTKEDIKRIIKILVIYAVLNSIYALFQIYTPFRFILRYGPDKKMASGISGNPNFFGSMIVTILSIITTKFLHNSKISIKEILLIFLIFISLINCQSTGPFITYIITIIFLIIYLFIKKKIVIKKIFYLLLILLITYLSIFVINKYIFNIKRCELCDLTIEVNEKITNKEDSNKFYSISNGRVNIWKKSLNIVKENPINGVGFDNFYLAYYEGINLTEVYFTSVDGQLKAHKKYPEIIDNAHNVYLHTLVSSGLLGLIPYLILCLYTFIRGLKSKDNIVIMLLGGFIAYSIQAFGNISVIQVAPIYYIIIGLILSQKTLTNK